MAGPTKLIVKEKLLSWSGDSFSIKQYPSGLPFGNGLQVKGKTWSMRDQMTLVDGQGRMVASACVNSNSVAKYSRSTFRIRDFPDKGRQSKHTIEELYTHIVR